MTNYDIGELIGLLKLQYRVRTHGETSSSKPPFWPWNWETPVFWKGTAKGVGSVDNIETYLRTCHPEDRRRLLGTRSCPRGGVIITLEGIPARDSDASRLGLAPGYFHIKITPELTGLVPDPLRKGEY